MSLEGFFSHPLLIWEWMAWVGGFAIVRIIIGKVWKHGKKSGRTEYDEYKKWETRFKEEKRLKE